MRCEIGEDRFDGAFVAHCLAAQLPVAGAEFGFEIGQSRPMAVQVAHIGDDPNLNDLAAAGVAGFEPDGEHQCRVRRLQLGLYVLNTHPSSLA